MAVAYVNSILASGTIATGATTAITSASFTPPAGAVLVVKSATQDATATTTTISGGGLTWTARVTNYGTGGTDCAVSLWTATVTTSAAMTVSVTFSNPTTNGSAVCAFVVDWYSGAQIAATPAIGQLKTDTTNALASITTTVANSYISWIDADFNVMAGPATYAGGASQAQTFTSAGAVTAWWAYQAAGAAGAKTFGTTAPTGQSSNLVGIEVQPAGAVAANPKLSSLVTNFMVNPTFFDGNYGGAFINANGQAETPTTNTYSGFSTTGLYDLTSDSVYAKIVTASGLSGTRQNSIKLIIDANNSVEMMLSGGTFRGRVQKAGVNTDVTLATYSATTHAWWRIREAAGTVYWDTSTDGTTWTNRGTAVHGLGTAIGAVVLRLQAGYFGAAGSEVNPPNAVYDNLNTTLTQATGAFFPFLL